MVPRWVFEDPSGRSAIQRSIVRAVAPVLDLVFPPVCTICDDALPPIRPSQRFVGICPACIDEMSLDYDACRVCAGPVPPDTGITQGCPLCLRERFRFRQAVALGVYSGAVREAVLMTKSANGESATVILGRLLALSVCRRYPEDPPDCVTPVPMHWLRRIVRRTSGADVLAETIARTLRVPHRRLLKCRRTKKQGTLSPAERRENVRGAFRVSTGYDISGSRILLVDDVMTTGATANECAKVLRKCGAASVAVAVIARGAGTQVAR